MSLKIHSQILTLGTLALVAATSCLSAPVTLRFQPSEYEIGYLVRMKHQETLVDAEEKLSLKDFKVANQLTQTQVPANNGALQVHIRSEPVAASLDGRKIALQGVTGEMNTESHYQMSDRGQRQGLQSGWTPRLPESPVEVGASWIQTVLGPDGELIQLNCRFNEIQTKGDRKVAKLQFRSSASKARSTSRAASKWKIQGNWSFDINKGVLLSSQTRTTLVAKFDAQGQSKRFVRKIIQEVRLNKATPLTAVAAD